MEHRFVLESDGVRTVVGNGNLEEGWLLWLYLAKIYPDHDFIAYPVGGGQAKIMMDDNVDPKQPCHFVWENYDETTPDDMKLLKMRRTAKRKVLSSLKSTI